MIDLKDIRIDVFRDSSPNPMYLVRLTHISTGLVAESRGNGTKHESYEQALEVLRKRVKGVVRTDG